MTVHHFQPTEMKSTIKTKPHLKMLTLNICGVQRLKIVNIEFKTRFNNFPLPNFNELIGAVGMVADS